MLRLTELKLPLDHPEGAVERALAAALGLPVGELRDVSIARRAWDARKRSAIYLVYSVDFSVADEAALLRRAAADKVLARTLGKTPDTSYRPVAQAPALLAERPVVIGTGPCGIFAALILAEMGFRPIILDRGKVVRDRTKDTWGLWRRNQLVPESNVQFGEGGAGTFSDGKLWSGIKDPQHLGRKVLTEFVQAGAPEEILYVAKPHIGTFRLVTMVESLRAKIESLGGEYRFGTKVVDFNVETGRDGQRRIAGVVTEAGETIETRHVVLAIGHSARDTFESLHAAGVFLEAKPFSIGVRIEHPQSIIDRARFGDFAGNRILGAADYKLVHHASNGRGVYSFCMCPGGTVVAAASEPGRLVTNGMSQYSRAERNANAGIVVGITPEVDFPDGPLAGIALQRQFEARAFIAGGSDYRAPAQLVGDFLAGRASTSLGAVVPSYRPGVTPTDLSTCLPDFAVAAMREALPAFGKQIRGFDMAEAVMTGVETRTSSPLRIRRDASLQSLNTLGLYPAGEGAGYAGGIFSAGVDGIRVAEAVGRDMAGFGGGRVKNDFDVIVLGAGAAGLFCAMRAGQRGRRVLLLDHAEEPGKKILISGGGRCNFTNTGCEPGRFLSTNPHFARSALSRYTAADFIALVRKHRIAFHEKTLGQLFCDGSARQIVAMLLAECQAAGVDLRCAHRVGEVSRGDRFQVATDRGSFTAESLVLATGGLSIPKMGATGFAHDLARRFGLALVAPRPGLVPLTFADAALELMRPLSGLALDVVARAGKPAFREAMLFTHRGLSGPAILQASSYWKEGAALTLDLVPETDATALLLDRKRTRPKQEAKTVLGDLLPSRLAQAMAALHLPPRVIGEIGDAPLKALGALLKAWRLEPSGTEGYAKAEVTLGGIDTAALSSQSMAAKDVPGLYVVGEAVDVTGWLGGYNFQWAWSSGWAAGEAA